MKIWAIIVTIVVAFAALIGISAAQQPKPEPETGATVVDCANPAYDQYEYDLYERSLIKGMAACIDYTETDPLAIHEASVESGGLADIAVGAKTPIVTIVEFADFQCSYCAEMNTKINQLLKEHDEQIRVVFHSYVLSHHAKGTRAASAAIAAAMQGYWHEFASLVFANQGDWYYAGDARFQKQLEDYFMTASGNEGDLEQFRADMKSEAVARRLAFDLGLGEQINLEGTPTFCVNGEATRPSELVEKVTELLEK